jgi:hypothetical protein
VVYVARRPEIMWATAAPNEDSRMKLG